MDTNFNNQKDNIARIIQGRVSILKCPVCESAGSLVMGDGYLAHDIQTDLQSRHIGGQNIPTVPIVCKNCGFLMEFSVGALGLLPKQE